ncbi:MAG: hypothetical protein ACPGUD_01810 [Parashewanella sp.]
MNALSTVVLACALAFAQWQTAVVVFTLLSAPMFAAVDMKKVNKLIISLCLILLFALSYTIGKQMLLLSQVNEIAHFPNGLIDLCATIIFIYIAIALLQLGPRKFLQPLLFLAKPHNHSH